MEYSTARNRMVETQLVSRGIKDPRVLEAMRTVPRHRFMEEAFISQAYNDHPLPREFWRSELAPATRRQS